MSLWTSTMLLCFALLGCGAAHETTAEPTPEPAKVNPVPESQSESEAPESGPRSEEVSEEQPPEEPGGRADLPEQPTRQEVAQVMHSLVAPIRECGNTAGGRAVLTARVVFRGSDGTVDEVEIAGNVSQQVQECASEVVRGVQVQPFRKPTFKVSFPYRL